MAGKAQMQNRVVKGCLVALTTVALMGFAVADLDVEAVFDDQPPAAVAATADPTVPPLTAPPLALVGLPAGVLENDILNRMVSRISTIAPAGEPIADRTLEPQPAATMLGLLDLSTTTGPAEFAMAELSAAGLPAVFAMTDFGPREPARAPVQQAEPAVPP